MKTLTENITAVLGQEGQNWLKNLPETVFQLAAYWELDQITPVANMTFNYVAKAQRKTQPVVLKISCLEKFITPEKNALAYFNGHGSINAFDYNDQYNALLLQQAVPGISLKSLYPAHIDDVMDIYIATMKKLHAITLPTKHHFITIHDWLKALDKLTPKQVPRHLLEKALKLKDSLLAKMGKQMLLHGDLHHDNILQHGDEWLAIDARGVVGEEEFEIAAFDFLYVDELAGEVDAKAILRKRISTLAKKAQLDTQRLHDWVFVRLILMAAWALEDNLEPSGALKLAEMLSRD